MALPCLPHLRSQNLGVGWLWGRAALQLTGQSAGGRAGSRHLGGMLCLVLCTYLRLCMLCHPCALVCCLCQCEDTIKCIFLWMLTFGDFVGVAIVQGSNRRSSGAEDLAWVF